MAGVLLFVEDDYYLHSKLREFEAVPGEPQHVYLQLSMFQNVASSLANGLRFVVRDDSLRKAMNVFTFNPR